MPIRAQRPRHRPPEEKPRVAAQAALPAAVEIDRCRRCDLCRRATRGVAGEGPAQAEIVLIGEQPGDSEDRLGRPFVGPAGRLLDQLLLEAGLERSAVYVTNAVKHFKWEARGKRRLHRRPTAAEIDACHVWLDREIEAIRPTVIIALGGSAARALLHRAAPVEATRGRLLSHPSGARIFVTYHPSAVLRADRAAARVRGMLVEDLKRAAQALVAGGPSPRHSAS